ISLKCHQCHNLETSDCYKIDERKITSFLKECPSNTLGCAIKLKKAGIPEIFRECADNSWVCDDRKFKCDKCTEDGCNSSNEIKTNVLISSINYLSKYWTVGVLIFVIVALVVLWCVLKMRSDANFG
uniref:Protein quiver n=1 Tax=Glossina brevipalpis TaxID=37001 RepID=A0A1A9WK57_9MUSC